MKKIILFLVAVSCLGFAQAQRVTKIYVSGEGGAIDRELKGDTLYYSNSSQTYRPSYRLSFEFENGETALNGGDTVVIMGTFAAVAYEGYESPYTINGKDYKGLLFIVPAGGIAPNDTWVFKDNANQAVTSKGEDGRVNATAKCAYTSGYGHLEKATPDVMPYFYLFNTNGIAESAIAAVKVFPTLASDEIQVINLKNTDVAIYSLVGQQMVAHSDLSGNVSIDVSTLANGIYFVKMQNGSAVRTEKIKIVR